MKRFKVGTVALLAGIFIIGGVVVTYRNIRAAEEDTSTSGFESEIKESVEELKEQQSVILKRIDTLEQALIQEIRARCTR